MKIQERNTLIDKSRTRKDGIYSYQGYRYAVRGGGMIAFADYSGNIFTCHGAFNMVAGKVERYNIDNALKGILKNK